MGFFIELQAKQSICRKQEKIRISLPGPLGTVLMGLHHWQCRDGGAQYKKTNKRKRFRDRRATFTTVYVVGW
jgi:hypothetical protein